MPQVARQGVIGEDTLLTARFTRKRGLKYCALATLFPWKFPESQNREHYLISSGISRNVGQGQAVPELCSYCSSPQGYLVGIPN